MTRSVSDDRYGKLRRRLDEVARRVDQGTLPYEDTMSALQLVAEGELPRPRFKRDMTKEAGWTLESDVGFNPAIRSIIELGLVNFLNDDEQSVSGDGLAKRAKLLNANLGQKHAEWLLDHHEEIPEEWRGVVLVFPGTVWRRTDGHRPVPYLGWIGRRWRLDFHWLDIRLRSGARLVRPRV